MSKAKELAVILVLVGFLAFLPSLFGGFVWDDEDFVYNNAYVKEARISRFFTENAIAGAGKTSDYYRPVQFSLYSLLYRLAGPAPFVFHMASVLLHTATALSVFLLLLRLTKRTHVSFFTSLIFLIHPVATESVSYISGLSDPLYAVFFFGSVLLYLDRGKSAKHMMLSLVLFVLALLSKELALILPAILILISLFHEKLPLAKSIVSSLPFSVIAGLYLAARLTFLKFSDISAYWQGTVYGTSFEARLATFFHNFFTYAALLIFPRDLFMERDYTTQILTSVWNVWTLLFIAAAAAVTIILLIFRKKTKNSLPLLFYLSFMASLVPYTGIFLLNGMFYEHYMYLPMIFFFAFLSCLLAPVFKMKNAWLIAGTLAVLLAVRSYVRQWDWIDAERFYRQTLVRAPESVRIINGLGMTLADKGNCAEAIRVYDRAIRVDPKVPNPYHNIANCYMSMGDYAKSEAYFLKATTVAPKFGFSYISLLKLYLTTGQTKKAKSLIETKINALYPGNPEIERVYAQLKNIPETDGK